MITINSPERAKQEPLSEEQIERAIETITLALRGQTHLINDSDVSEIQAMIDDYQNMRERITKQFEDEQRAADNSLNEDDPLQDEDHEDYEQNEDERRAEIAANCRCGAWLFGKKGVVHVSDCYCGAE